MIINVMTRWKTVVSEYIGQTLASIVNALFYIILYPMIMPILGPQGYGEVVYAMAITSFISIAMSAGFEMPGLNYLSSSNCDSVKGGAYISSVLNIRLLVFALGALFLLVALHAKPQAPLIMVSLINVFANGLIFNWVFIARQKSQVVAKVMAISKIFALWVIYIYVSEPGHSLRLLIITGLSNLVAAVYLYYYMWRVLKYKFSHQAASEAYRVFRESIPFFWSGGINLLKHRSIEVVIGSFLGMSAIAVYDLANKIYTLPAMLVTAINSSIFSRYRTLGTDASFKHIFLMEVVVASVIVLGCALFGPWFVSFLGKGQLDEAYFILLTMSFNIFPFMLVGCLIYLKLLPMGRSDLIISNQLVALCAYLCCLGVLLKFTVSLQAVVFALVLSGIAEMLYCLYVYKKHILRKS